MAFRPSLRPLTPVPGASELFGLGCAPIGNLYEQVAEDAAAATVDAALSLGVRFFDTAPHYGAGVSERRLGDALRGVDRSSVAIATKVGRRIVDGEDATVAPGGTGVRTVGDLTGDGVLRSAEGSLLRLGTDRIDLLYLHDPVDVDEALRTAVPALVRLREEGTVRAIGAGMVRPGDLARLVREADLDVAMIAGRLTPLDRTALAALVPAAAARGTGIIAAGVFNSGILADPGRAPYFDYRPASADLVARAVRMQEVCREHGVELAHAAARYPLRFGPVEAVVVGARTPAEVAAFVAAERAPIPDALWPELDAA